MKYIFLGLIFTFFLFSTGANSAEANASANGIVPKDVGQILQKLVNDNLHVRNHPELPEFLELGTLMASTEFNTQAYRLGLKSNFEPRYRLETQDLSDFLSDSGLAQQIGQISVENLLNKKLIPNRLKSLHKYVEKEKLNQGVITFITSPKIEPSYFEDNNFFRAIIFPKKGLSLDGVQDNLKWLFQHDDEIARVFDKISTYNKGIKAEIEALISLFDNNASSDKRHEAFLASNLGPQYLRNRWANKQCRFENEHEKSYKMWKITLDVYKELENSLDQVSPSPLNAMLLYCFYLIEYDANQYYAQATDNLWENINLQFGIENSFPHKSLLLPHAHLVLERLGFFEAQKQSEISIEPFPEQSSKPKSKKCKKNKKASKKKKQKRKNVQTCPEINFKKSSECDEEKLEEPELSCPDQIEEVHEEAPCLKKCPSCFAFNNKPPKDNYLLKRGRAHCALDMLARLLRHEIYYRKVESAGTIALALVRNEKINKDQLVIATKYNLPKNAIYEYFSLLINGFPVGKELLDLRKARKSVQEAKDLFSNDLSIDDEKLACRNYLKFREFFDHQRFARIYKEQKSNIESRLINLLKNFNESSIMVLENSFFMHPELIIAEYILANGLKLDTLEADPTLDNQYLDYQYIGLSMLNCASCDALLRGHGDLAGINDLGLKQKLLIFTKGSYDVRYPDFFPLRLSLKANSESNRALIKKKLSLIGTCVRQQTWLDTFIQQEGELSEDEDF